MPSTARKASSLERKRTKRQIHHKSAPVDYAPPIELRERSHSFNMDIAMAHLVTHTELVDTLLQWVANKVSEQLVSDAYVRMGNELNLVIAHLDALNIPTREFGHVLPGLREILETCLSNDTPAPDVLDAYLSKVKTLLDGMKHSLQAKHLMYNRMVSAAYAPSARYAPVPPPAQSQTSAPHRSPDSRSQRSRASSKLTKADTETSRHEALPPEPHKSLEGSDERKETQGSKVKAHLRSMRSRLQLQRDDSTPKPHSTSSARRHHEPTPPQQASEQSVFHALEDQRETASLPRPTRHRHQHPERSLPLPIPIPGDATRSRADRVAAMNADDTGLPSPSSMRSFRSHQLPSVRYNLPSERFSLDDLESEDLAGTSHAYLWHTPASLPDHHYRHHPLAHHHSYSQGNLPDLVPQLPEWFTVAEKPVLPPLDLGSPTLSPTTASEEPLSTAMTLTPSASEAGQSVAISMMSTSTMPPLTPPSTATNEMSTDVAGVPSQEWAIHSGVGGSMLETVSGGITTESESLEALRRVSQLERRASKRRADFQLKNRKNSIDLDSLAAVAGVDNDDDPVTPLSAILLGNVNDNRNTQVQPVDSVSVDVVELKSDGATLTPPPESKEATIDDVKVSTDNKNGDAATLAFEIIISGPSSSDTRTKLSLDPQMTLSALWKLLVDSHGFSDYDARSQPKFVVSSPIQGCERAPNGGVLLASGEGDDKEATNRASGASFASSVDSIRTIQAQPPRPQMMVPRKPVPSVALTDSTATTLTPDIAPSLVRPSNSRRQSAPVISSLSNRMAAQQQQPPLPSSMKRPAPSRSRIHAPEALSLDTGRTISTSSNGEYILFGLDASDKVGVRLQDLLPAPSSSNVAANSSTTASSMANGEEAMDCVADGCWIKFQWPGYGQWEMQLNNPIPGVPFTRTKLAQIVATKFIQGLKRLSQNDADPTWSIGPGKSVDYGDLRLVSLIHESGVRWLANFDRDHDSHPSSTEMV